jgi:hypothetical protein
MPLLNVFSTVKAADAWWNTDWSYRKTITIDHTKVSGPLSDFPVLIDITDANLASAAQPDGDDIAFVDVGTGAKLNHEIESYDSGSGRLIARVKVPSLSQLTDTVVYMYYGNTAAGNQQNPMGVWDSNAKMVLHLDETSGTQHDSSVNANNVVPYGGVLQGVSGRIAGANTFDGVNDYLQAPHSNTLAGFSQGFTASFWLRLDDVSRRQTIVNKYNSAAGQRGWYVEYQANMLGFFASQDGSSYGEWHAAFRPTVGVWYFIAVTWEPSAVPKFYVNGLQVATSGTAKIGLIYSNAGVSLYIGRCQYDVTRYIKGGLDEICLSNSGRSLDWTRTSYNNQASPSTFYSAGPQEVPASEAPIISNISPSNGATGVPVSISQLSFNLTDLQTDLIDYTVTTSPNIGSGGGTGEVNGEYSISINHLNYATTYTWTVVATDGENSNGETFTFTTQSLFPWWDTSWQYRRTITIDHTKVSSDHTDFPVLIDLADSGLTTKAQANGNDFVFTDANQVKLSHEIESYGSGSGHLVVWARIPMLSSTTDTTLYMYYGNLVCGNQQAKTAVWDSSNRMILHLAETTGTQYDSTINGNNATPNNAVIQGTAGKIAGSDTFDGTNDYLLASHSSTLTGFSQGFTVSFWVRLEDTAKRQMLLCKYNTGTSQRSWYVEYQNHVNYGKVLGFFASQDGTAYKEWYAAFAPTAGTWYYVTVVWQSNTVLKFYVNGAQVTTRNTGIITSIYNNVGVPLLIGRCAYDATRYFKGSVDDIRISNSAVTAGWILSSYNSQKDPTTFYQLGTEEERALTLEPFAIVVLPDTRIYSQSYPAIFSNQTQWIVGNVEDMNTVSVLHEGDIVNSDVTAQWINANASMSLLDEHVPWSVLPGNHDGANVGTVSENLVNYNTYFSYNRFSDETWYGDAYNSVNTNSFILFSGGYDDYIIFNFQYHPSDAVLAWATTTINAHPNRRAIVVTHDYLNTDGTRTPEGDHIWGNFVSMHADQIFLVLCGHNHGEARRQDTVNGHVIYQVLADYQTRDNGGNGWLRILDFHPAEDMIQVKTFSPYLNIWETDADSQFTLNYDMSGGIYDDVIFDSSFETGNLKNVQFQSGDASGNRVYTGEQDHTTVSGMTDKHWWFYFSMENVAGKTVTVKLVNNEVGDMATRWGGMEPVYSFDNINWERLPLSNFVVDIPECTFQMTVTLSSEQNKILLAPLPPYTIATRDALLTESSPYLDVTSLGTAPGGQELKVATITDSAYSDSNKIKAYVIAMQHSTEVPGGWEADGMIRFLLSDDPTAQAIRRSYMFRIVPIVNVDGVYQGVSRYTPLRSGVQYDLNREWNKASYETAQPEVQWIWDDISTFQPDSFNDLHSTIGAEGPTPEDAVTYTWSGGTTDPTVVAFLNKIHDAGWPDTYRGTSPYACSQVHSRLNVIKSISWENPQDEFLTNPGHKLTINDWREMGKAYAKGVYLDGGGVSYFASSEHSESAERWMDVADQVYSISYQGSYEYSQAPVSVQYSVFGEILTGTLTAQNLKPNFAYQLKLVGTPGTADNELIGYAGRWWQEEWDGAAWVKGQNLNDKGTGYAPYPNDAAYLAGKSITDSSSPTGLHYRYTGYLLFGYFITDSNGDTTLYFETGNCCHVLWKTNQRDRVAEDGPLKSVTFDPVLSTAYDVDYPSSTISIYGEWERLPMGSVNLDTGSYNCQLVLTEESFHGTGELEGNWAAAVGTEISFTIAS